MTNLYQEQPPLKPHYPKPSSWRFLNKHKDVLIVLTFFTVFVVFVSGLGEKKRVLNSYADKVFPIVQLLEHDAKSGTVAPTKIELGKKKLIINFTSSWCEHCHEQIKVLQDHYNVYHHVINIVLQEPTPPAAYLAELHKAGGRVMFDTQNKLARMLDINSLPTMLILDTDGKMIFRLNDTVNEEDFEKYINKTMFPKPGFFSPNRGSASKS